MQLCTHPKLSAGLLLVSLVWVAAEAWATEPNERTAVDRRQYNLFHPVPRADLRELITDRPSLSDGPFTLDPGHFQFEMDFVNYTHDRDTRGGGDTRTDAWLFAPFNFRVGLLHNLDLQFIVAPDNRVRTEDRAAGVTTRQSGFGDVTLRAKLNLWGNDEGDTALAFLPYLKLPTSQDHLGNHAVEGGFSFPFTVNLPAEWQLGLMTKWSYRQDGGGDNYHSEFEHSIILGRDICGKLAGYAEFYSLVSTERGSDWLGIVGLGLTYGLTDNVQLDTGINLGVTRSAPDYNPWVGITWRF
jgi:hypothetical protein